MRKHLSEILTLQYLLSFKQNPLWKNIYFIEYDNKRAASVKALFEDVP